MGERGQRDSGADRARLSEFGEAIAKAAESLLDLAQAFALARNHGGGGFGREARVGELGPGPE